MNFISLEFLIFVLGAMLFYYIMPKRERWMILLIFSYIFYYLASEKLIIFLLISTLSIFLGGLALNKINNNKIDPNLDKEEKKQQKKKKKFYKKTILIFIILVNIGILATLKYNNFLGSISNSLFATDIAVKYFIMPLGISYYTLQALSYIIDVYFGKYKATANPFKVALFMSFFPQMVEGPIGRFDRLGEQLWHGNKFNYDKTINALVLIGWGYFKKLVIADRAAMYVNVVFQGEYTGSVVLLAIILYTVQIYSEFSGAMDIVLGIGELFGIKLDKNFKQPFFSKSINEFWRRWHITLGTWLKDYIFYPISLSKFNLKLSKWARTWKIKHLGQFVIIAFPLFFVWIINGIWHGPALKYILYGLYYYILMMLGILLKPLFNKIIKIFKIKTKVFSFKLFQMLRTTTIVLIGLTIFRAETITSAIEIIKSIFIFKPHDKIINMNLGLTAQDFNILIIGMIAFFCISILKEFNIDVRKKLANQNLLFRWCIYLLIIFSVIIFGIYGPGYNATSFIYGGF